MYIHMASECSCLRNKGQAYVKTRSRGALCEIMIRHQCLLLINHVASCSDWNVRKCCQFCAAHQVIKRQTTAITGAGVIGLAGQLRPFCHRSWSCFRLTPRPYVVGWHVANVLRLLALWMPQGWSGDCRWISPRICASWERVQPRCLMSTCDSSAVTCIARWKARHLLVWISVGSSTVVLRYSCQRPSSIYETKMSSSH